MGRPHRAAHRGTPGEAALRLSTVSRYWHTLRHLKPVQFYGRAWFRLWRPRPDLAPPPDVRACTGVWQPPAARDASLAAADTFVFLGERGALPDIGWDGPQREKLWRYNQHYFDDLNAAGAAARSAWHTDLVQDWIARNPPGQGTGWEPYPASLRIVNWVKWALGGQALSRQAVHSLAVQARWVSQRLEIHLLGNHLFSNAKALVFAGSFFAGPEADRWRRAGLRILEQQLREQVLADGGHFERSTMYHALALEDVLDLCNLFACCQPGDAERQAAAHWREVAARMLGWLHAMCHPDGDIAFFNDAAFGIAPHPRELAAYAARLGIDHTAGAATASQWLDASGYARLQNVHAVALLDLAPVGPDYLPGHAHADTLSFELSVRGQRLLVNGGTSCYGTGPQRLKERGTAAHNTVTVEGRDSSEVWSGFRVARRARVQARVQAPQEGVQVAEGTHDGYARLPGRPLHRRQWQLRDGALVVEDTVGAAHAADARFHFHPDVAVAAAPDSAIGTATLPGGKAVRWRVENGGGARLEAAHWHPRFGVALPGTCLVVPLQEGRARVVFEWEPPASA